jgi:hypothetical protein
MSKKSNKAAKPVIREKPQALSGNSTSWLERVNHWLERKEKPVISFIMLLSAILCFINFDVKLSIGHDDALYVEGGFNYAKDFFGYYYTANAPLYVMFLALPISIWGINLIALKIFSIVFFLGSNFVLYRAFRIRIPFAVLIPVFFLIATNWYLIQFASLTYTECFYMLMAAIFIWVFFKTIEVLNVEGDKLKSVWTWLAGLAFMLFVLAFTRNIAVVSIIAVLVYLLSKKWWRSAILVTLLFFGFRTGYDQVREAIWGSQGQFSNQMDIILRKEAYNPDAGLEDFEGFKNRFIDNNVIYLSGRFYEILGLKEELTEYKPSLSVITIILLLTGLLVAFIRKQSFLVASFLYSGSIIGATFFALQTSWGQGRFIMIHVPFMMLIIFYLFYSLFNSVKAKGASWVYFLIISLFAFPGFSKAFKNGKSNISTLKKNLSGDVFAGYTEDYRNYLKLSQWCADSLPPNSVVACRKSPMSFVYGKGMNFQGVYQADEKANPDSVLKRLHEAHITHVILASIRVNPKMPADENGGYINTVHRLIYPIQDRLEFVKQEGTSEPSMLYKIIYKGTPYEQN